MTDGLKKAAVFCFLTFEDSFLLMKRNFDPNKGKFVPPGGKIKPYESPIAAVIREVKEETGLEITDMKLTGLLTETSPTSYNWISYIYKAAIDRIIIDQCDEGAFFWIPKNQWHDIDTPPTDIHIYPYITTNQPFIIHALYDEYMNMVECTEDLSGEILFRKENF